MSLFLDLLPILIPVAIIIAAASFLKKKDVDFILEKLGLLTKGASTGILKRKRNIGGGFKLPKKYILAGVLLILFLLLGFRALTIVPAGYSGVVFNLQYGVRDTPINPGIHIIIPFIETVTMMETRTQLTEQEASAVSKDLQIVTTSVALNYRPIVDATPRLYQEIGENYAERIILPTIQESVKAVMANYTAEQLIVERPKVKQDIKESLVARLSERDIIVDDVSITNFQFSAQFDDAIEEKVTAEQQALKAERDLDRIKIEKEQTITQAEARAESVKKEADAEAYKIQVISDAEAYKLKVVREELEKGKDLISYKAIEIWDGVLPKFIGGGTTPFIDVSSVVN